MSDSTKPENTAAEASPTGSQTTFFDTDDLYGGWMTDPAQAAVPETPAPAPTDEAQETKQSSFILQTKTRISRGQCIGISLPVTIQRQTGESETTRTFFVFPTGAVIGLKGTAHLGQRFELRNPSTGKHSECKITGVEPGLNGTNQVEIEFVAPIPHFWQVHFPKNGSDEPKGVEQAKPAAAGRPSPTPTPAVESIKPAVEESASKSFVQNVLSAHRANTTPDRKPLPVPVKQSSPAFTATFSEPTPLSTDTPGLEPLAASVKEAAPAGPIIRFGEPVGASAAHSFPKSERSDFWTRELNALESTPPTTKRIARKRRKKRMVTYTLISLSVLAAVAGTAIAGRHPFKAFSLTQMVSSSLPATTAVSTTAQTSGATPASTAVLKALQPSANLAATTEAKPAKLQDVNAETAPTKLNESGDKGSSLASASEPAGQEEEAEPRILEVRHAAVAPPKFLPSEVSAGREEPPVSAGTVTGIASATQASDVLGGIVSAASARKPALAVSRAKAPRLLSSPPPVYPAMARASRIEGEVMLLADIDARGNVVHTKVVNGVPYLQTAAQDAVRKWKYEPATLNDNPIPYQVQVKIRFSLK